MDGYEVIIVLKQSLIQQTAASVESQTVALQ